MIFMGLFLTGLVSGLIHWLIRRNGEAAVNICPLSFKKKSIRAEAAKFSAKICSKYLFLKGSYLH
jgi:hypothetical protein